MRAKTSWNQKTKEEAAKNVAETHQESPLRMVAEYTMPDSKQNSKR
jgi:hypothetical protein